MGRIELFLFLSLIGCFYAAQPTVDEKVSYLQDLMYRQPVMRLNLDRWRTYVRTQPRNYSMIVMFTALSPGVNCPICKPAYDEFVILANSYRHQHIDAKSVYFGVVDYEEAPQIFQQMNLNTAPILYHFGPKLQGKKKPEKMDFQRHGFDAEALARFVSDNTDMNIRITRPPNYTFTIVAIFLVVLLIGLVYLKRDSLEFAQNKTTWGLICVTVVFIFMSGQMWNHIRGPPFVMTNPNTKETSFIHGSTQYQLVSETYIVGILYGIITFGFIMLSDAIGSEDKVDKKKHKPLITFQGHTMVYFALGLVAIFFSLLISIFRSKYRGYPYSFLFS
ncbi:unnamed protein product [Auanema sp. JU1783]|nr:unnamed protein product [Auanema sp. JU1783]